MRFYFKYLDKSWERFMLDKKTSKKLKTIQKSLKGKQYYPSRNNVLRFTKNDLNKVKYVIVGMDPYPQCYVTKDKYGENKKYPVATGRCFEPANYNSWGDSTNNKSIVNILKAIYTLKTNKKSKIADIRNEIKNNEFNILPPRQFFDYLEEQGVLLLNYALTVEPNKPGSHLELWKDFSIHLINYIDSNYEVTWVLLGKDAQELQEYIKSKRIITDVHPTNPQFYISNKCLSQMNIDFTGQKKKTLK